MVNMIDTILINHLISDEGIRLKPYKDTEGKITIGVGRNLEDEGISQYEAMYLLNNDIERIEQRLGNVPSFDSLTRPRQRVLIEMAFNIGFEGLMEFKDMWSALRICDWDGAANAMLDSLWAKEVGQRAVRLATSMRNNTNDPVGIFKNTK